MCWEKSQTQGGPRILINSNRFEYEHNRESIVESPVFPLPNLVSGVSGKTDRLGPEPHSGVSQRWKDSRS